MTDAMPTLPESEASGAAAALYADIRGVTGVPVVNLIWRRLAFFPGALEWAWAAVRPLYAGGLADAAAARILAETPLPDLPPWPDPLLPAAGLSGADRTAVIRMLASYDRGNRLNLAALGALLQALEGAPADGPPPAAGAARGRRSRASCRRSPRWRRSGPRCATLCSRSTNSATAAIPWWRASTGISLTGRATWRSSGRSSRPLDRDGRLAAAIAGGAEAAREASAGIAGGLALPAGRRRPKSARRSGQFVRGPIARMTPVSALLLRLLGK